MSKLNLRQGHCRYHCQHQLTVHVNGYGHVFCQGQCQFKAQAYFHIENRLAMFGMKCLMDFFGGIPGFQISKLFQYVFKSDLILIHLGKG